MTTQNPGCLTSLLSILRIRSRSRQNQDVFPYRVRDDFLSPAEISFYHVLKGMTGEKLTICPQVSLAALLFVSGGDNYRGDTNRISQKRVDFLLCDPKTMKPVLAIELDDASHQRSEPGSDGQRSRWRDGT